MSNSMYGVQLNTKVGADFATQYGDPNTTMPNDFLTMIKRIVFEGAQTQKVPGQSKDEMFAATFQMKPTDYGSDVGKKINTYV